MKQVSEKIVSETTENTNTKYKSCFLVACENINKLVVLEELSQSLNRYLLAVKSGKDILALALSKEIDLILLEKNLPDINGLEVVDILTSSNRTKDIPIIFILNNEDEKLMLTNKNKDRYYFLNSPLDKEITREKLALLLQLRQQKKEIASMAISLEQKRLIIENSKSIIGIIDANTFKIEEINRTFETITGYSIDETKESTLTLFLSDEDRLLVEKIRKQNRPLQAFETRIYCKNRSIKWLRWNISVKNGKWLAEAHDITEIKLLEEIKNYIAIVVKQSNDAIYILDSKGSIISWNSGAEKVYGYLEPEALNMNVRNIIPGYEKLQVEELLSALLNEQKMQNIETKRITKHGKMVDILFSASLIVNAEHGEMAISITERDITEQKKAEEKIKQLNTSLQENVLQLELSNKELESFSYSISHDLRAPLRAINGYAKLIATEYAATLDNEARILFGNIQDNANRMSLLIDDLLEFSKLGKKSLKKVTIDMEQLANTVMKQINDSMPNKAKITIHQMPDAFGDLSLISQVFTNLLSNAVKYSSKKENPIVEVGFYQTDEVVTYYVKDNGAGFNNNYVDKLFGVFQRLHNSADFEGTGVGLAIVNRIITKHGGRIWAEAKIEEGATFYFTL